MFKLMEEVQVKDTAGNKKMLRLNCETFQKKWTPIKYISHEPATHSWPKNYYELSYERGNFSGE